MARFLWICLGGAIGTGARYLTTGWALRVLGPGFPWGTLTVNVVGSFLIGLIMHLGLSAEMIPPGVRVALTTGVMGGFTTFSTFSYETIESMRTGAFGLAALNVVVTLIGCLAACWAGLAVGRALAPS